MVSLSTFRQPSRVRIATGRRGKGTIPFYSKSSHSSTLPTLVESSSEEELFDSETEASTSITDVDTSVLLSRVDAQLERNQALALRAYDLAMTGREKDAIKLYKMITNQNRSEIGKLRNSKDQSLRIRKARWTLGESHASICTTLAILYDRLGELDVAVTVAREALDFYKERALREQSQQVLSSLEERCQVLESMCSKIKNAQMTKQERNAKRMELKTKWNDVTRSSDLAQQSVLLEKLKSDATSLLQQEIDTVGQQHPLVADLYMMIGRIDVARRDYNEALKLMKKGLAISRVVLGEAHPQTAKKLIDIAKAYECQAEKEVAIEYYSSALVLFDATSDAHVKTRFMILNDRASLYTSLARLPMAIQDYANALDLSKSNPQLVMHRVSCMKSLVQCYLKQHRFDRAIKVTVVLLEVLRVERQRLQRQSKKNTKDPTNQEAIDDSSIANALVLLAQGHLGAGNLELTQSSLKEAAAIYRAQRGEYFDVKNFPLLLLATAELKAALGDSREARKCFKTVFWSDEASKDDSLRLRACLGEFFTYDESDHEQKDASSKALSKILQIAGSSSSRPQLLHELDSYFLTKSNTWMLRTKTDEELSSSHTMKQLRLEGQYDEALKETKVLLETQKVVFLKLPKDCDLRSRVMWNIGTTLKALGDIYLVLGKEETAKSTYQKAIDVLTKLENSGELVRELEQKMEILSSIICA